MIAALVATLLAATRPGELMDHVLHDALSTLAASGEAPAGVLVVGIDEPSFAELGLRWPWPRAIHAALVERLFERGAAVVALDLVLAEASAPQDDAALTAAVRRFPTLLFAADVNVLEQASHRLRTLVSPTPVLEVPRSRLGTITLPVDNDGFVRTVARVDAKIEPLSLKAARLLDDRCCGAFQRALASGRAYVPFETDPGVLPYVSYYQALSREPLVPDERFQDRMVFVGVATQTANLPESTRPEFFPVPPTRWGAPLSAGVEIHARSAAAALAGGHRARVDDLISLSAGLLLSLLLGLRLRGSSAGRCLLYGVGALVLVSATTGLLFVFARLHLAAVHVALPLIGVTAVNAFHHYIETAAQKRFIQLAFQSYASPALVDALVRDPGRLALGGAAADASILFVDIAGFTSLSERHTPEELVELMNRILQGVTEAVLDHDGMVDKFIGDAVMAVWGVPVERPAHALDACRAALAIRQVIERFGGPQPQIPGTRIDARIGVNSGRVVAGNIGGRERFDYTVLGNEVNLASRIEGVNKLYGTRVLVGENTARLVRGHMVLRHVDDVRVKGKQQAVGVYELQAEGRPDADLARLNEGYSKAFQQYQAQRWQAARELFAALLADHPDDGPARTLHDRCVAYAAAPPESWDGAWQMDSK